MPHTYEKILGAVARGWCSPENAHKVMDTDLAVAIAKEVYMEMLGITKQDIAETMPPKSP